MGQSPGGGHVSPYTSKTQREAILGSLAFASEFGMSNGMGALYSQYYAQPLDCAVMYASSGTY
jgi:hypothetical protein